MNARWNPADEVDNQPHPGFRSRLVGRRQRDRIPAAQ
jgi:hypothetical protein